MTNATGAVAAASTRSMSLGGRFLRFAVVGGLGYFVNLTVYAALLHGLGVGYLGAATASFGVAVIP